MCDPGTLLIAATVAQAAGTVVKTVGAVQQHNYEAKVAEANIKAENLRIVDALDRGAQERQEAARKQAQMMGAQRASMAANGIDLGFGTAGKFLADTAEIGQREQHAVSENTRREVMAYDINAANFGGQMNASRSAAKGAALAGAFDVVSTLAGGASRYRDMQNGRKAA